jgi:hypothetical protein
MQTLPRDIHLGMKVYDNQHKQLGKIDDLRFSENEEEPDVQPAELDASDRENRDPTLMGAIAKAFGYEDVPEPLRSRLLSEGYIRIDSDGLFAADRYILPSQIASAAGDEVTLNVGKDQLIKKH